MHLSVGNTVDRKTLPARIGLLLIFLFGILIRRFSPEKIEEFLHAFPYRCPLRWITGWKCAFCGMTHSWIALMRGDFTTAFRENILGIPLFFITVVVLLIYSFNRRIDFKVKTYLWASTMVLVAYAIGRNVF